jgi:hypothetical protein
MRTYTGCWVDQEVQGVVESEQGAQEIAPLATYLEDRSSNVGDDPTPTPKPPIVEPMDSVELTDEQQDLWLDGVFLPALYTEHEGEDKLLQHFPTSY